MTPARKRHRAPWFKDGLRFECQRCGGCCSGESGYVELSKREADAVAKHLGISLDEFTERYTRTEYENCILLKEIPSDYGLDCIMLQRDPDNPAVTSCMIHECRPEQCSTWPFWPNNVASKTNWNKAAQRCPGVNKGPLHSRETIEKCCLDFELPMP
ncbi:YkgJ family cysteine cluster protein [bacterium]|nr:YkgJ family cysteine cluster protein [bacterium]